MSKRVRDLNITPSNLFCKLTILINNEHLKAKKIIWQQRFYDTLIANISSKIKLQINNNTICLNCSKSSFKNQIKNKNNYLKWSNLLNKDENSIDRCCSSMLTFVPKISKNLLILL